VATRLTRAETKKTRQVATRLTRAETKNIKKTGGYTLNPCVNIRSLWNSSRPTYLVKGFGVVRLLARSRNTWGPFKNLETSVNGTRSWRDAEAFY